MMSTVSGVFLHARCYASAGSSYGSVAVCVCLSWVGVLLNRLDRSSWFLTCSFLWAILQCIIMKFRGYFPLELGLGLRTLSGTLDLETWYQLRSTKVDAHSMINCSVVSRQYVRCDHQFLSAARVCYTGSSAIADTCSVDCQLCCLALMNVRVTCLLL